MKRNFYLLAILLTIGFATTAQTAFWQENFGTDPVCQSAAAAGFVSSNGSWVVTNTGTNDVAANIWYVSARESGMNINACSNGCLSNPTLINRTLHVGVFSGDLGAAYLAGNGIADTDKRVETPVINCSNTSAITLTLSYIMWGVNGSDYCQVQYYNGSTWSNLGIPAQTPTVSCAGQGIWTGYTVALPASADNNPNVKIGFRWQNVDNTGADPSVAIDNITLIGTVSTPTAVMSPSFTIPTNLCVGQSISLTANTGTTSATGYTWTAIPAGATFSSPNASVTNVSFANANTFSVTLTAASGTLVGSVTHTVIVNPLPTINASTTASLICEGNSSTLSATGGLSYTWTPGNLNGTPVVVSPTTTISYQVVGSNTFGCNNSATVTVYVAPKPLVVITSNTLNVCIGSSATLTAAGGVSYTWTPGSTNGSTLLITPSVNTTYTVVGTSSAGCTNSFTVAITTSTCSGGGTGIVANETSDLLFSVFPNPVKDKLIIKVGDMNLSNVKIELFDVVGKKLGEQNFTTLTANAEQSLEVNNLPKGVFILKMSTDGKVQKSIRLVKE